MDLVMFLCCPWISAFRYDVTRENRSVQSVISNDDLLTEILVRLPVLSLVLFKSVSKRWLSVIKDVINPTFRRNPNPLSGLFLNKYSLCYDFVPLDTRIPICGSSLLATKFTFGPDVLINIEILDSCNGLLLCRTLSRKLYVYNPSISNMFKVLPVPYNVSYHYYDNSGFGGKKLAFDPTKSHHYKVICVTESYPGYSVQIHTYSSEKGNWSVHEHHFPIYNFCLFSYGVYWNDAIYWIQGSAKFFKLDIMNEHSVLTALPTPLTLDRKFHYKYWLYESRGSLLLVGNDMPPFKCFTIFEKENVYSEWSVKYIVNLNDIIAEGLSIHERIHCIVLGEREEDTFLVWQSGRKVVQHKIGSKTLSAIYDLEPNHDLFKCFQFIPSFTNV